MKRRWLCGLALLGAAALAASAQSAPVAFTAPVTVISASHPDSVQTGEPRLIQLPSGRILLSAQWQQWDCAQGHPLSSGYETCVWASDDGGKHFHISGGDTQAGDDVDLAVTADGTVLQSAMANYDLGAGIGGSVIMRSTDRGGHWTQENSPNKSILNDRPFLLSTGHSTLLTYDSLPGGIMVVRSTDDGVHFGLPVPISLGSGVNGGLVVSLNGAPAWDPVHKIAVVPYVAGTDPTCQSGVSGCLDQLYVAYSRDDGLTWTNQHVLTLRRGTGVVAVPEAAVDAAGHWYLTLPTASGYTFGAGLFTQSTEDFHVSLLSSAAPGHRWTQLGQVDRVGGSATSPGIVADGNGHVAVAMYSSTWADAGASPGRWDVTLAQSHDGGHSWQRQVVAHDVYFGTGAAHQTYLWDLIGLARATNGGLLLAWSDQLGSATAQSVVRFARTR